jgi:tetratricopeptide (TPR) repeat protein
MPYQVAVRSFEAAIRAFQKQDYHKAADLFEKLADIDSRDIAERAQLHLRLCRQRTGRPAASPKSAEEFYAIGVACMNASDLDRAIDNLSKANKLKPKQEYIHYALAASFAMKGVPDAALPHLEQSIALRPENRYHARRDEDFRALAGDARFRSLVNPAGN